MKAIKVLWASTANSLNIYAFGALNKIHEHMLHTLRASSRVGCGRYSGWEATAWRWIAPGANRGGAAGSGGGSGGPAMGARRPPPYLVSTGCGPRSESASKRGECLRHG